MDSTENATDVGESGTWNARNYQRAEEVLRSALTQNPQDVMLLTEMARTKFLMGDHGAAERFALQGGWHFEPENGYPMRIYAATLGALGRRKEALSWAQRAIDAAPLDYLTHYELRFDAAGQRGRQGRCGGEPCRWSTEALRLGPDDADCHNLLGLVLGRPGPAGQVHGGVSGGTAAGSRARLGAAQHRGEPGPIADGSPVRSAGFREAAEPRSRSSATTSGATSPRRCSCLAVAGWAFVAWASLLYLCERAARYR